VLTNVTNLTNVTEVVGTSVKFSKSVKIPH